MTPKAYQIKWCKIKKYAIQRQEPTSNLKIDRSTAKRVKVASNAYLALIVAWLCYFEATSTSCPEPS